VQHKLHSSSYPLVDAWLVCELRTSAVPLFGLGASVSETDGRSNVSLSAEDPIFISVLKIYHCSTVSSSACFQERALQPIIETHSFYMDVDLVASGFIGATKYIDEHATTVPHSRAGAPFQL